MIPSSFTIRGRKWKVILASKGTLAEKDADGYCDYDSRTITVEEQDDPDYLIAVFFHEFFHACNSECGFNENEFFANYFDELVSENFAQCVLDLINSAR